MRKKTTDKAKDKITNVLNNCFVPQQIKDDRVVVLSQLRTGKENPEEFLKQLKGHFGYLNENWLDLVLYDQKLGIGFVNDDISFCRARFDGTGYAIMYHIPGRNKTQLEVKIPDLTFDACDRDGFIGRELGILKPAKYEMLFYVEPDGRTIRCYYNLNRLENKKGTVVHRISSGSFETHDLKRFIELVKKIEYIMVGTNLSLYTSGSFIGLVAKEGEYFLR